MQVNLHGTPCIPGVFFLLFWSYRKPQFSTNESTKIRHFDSKISKIFWGGGTALSSDPSPCGEGDTFSPHPNPNPRDRERKGRAQEERGEVKGREQEGKGQRGKSRKGEGRRGPQLKFLAIRHCISRQVQVLTVRFNR